jgi:hypothetical protein
MFCCLLDAFMMSFHANSTLMHLHVPCFRYQYERAMAETGFGTLLSKWDNRQTQSAELLSSADKTLKNTFSVKVEVSSDGATSEKSEVPLSLLFQLPVF